MSERVLSSNCCKTAGNPCYLTPSVSGPWKARNRSSRNLVSIKPRICGAASGVIVVRPLSGRRPPLCFAQIQTPMKDSF
jgi:hypothetical protein